MLAEARIILPLNDNLGNPLDTVHDVLMGELCAKWGGATRSATEGIWRSPSGKIYQEPGFAYDVAMDPTDANAEAMADLAQELAKIAKQECIYVRYSDGHVALIAPEPVAA